MKKNNFLQGAIVATLSIIICKILGLLYVIPFYSIIGTQGGALYSYAYSIYSIFLSLSTCGIPIAVSKLVSEYNALKEYINKEVVYKIALKIMVSIGILSFIIMFVFAKSIAYMFIGNIEGGNTLNEVATAIRVVSIALLVVPQQSVIRGYLEGHGMITTTSISSVLEQFVRVIIIIVGSFITVKVLKLPINCAVYVAIFAASIAALSSYIYLRIKVKNNKKNLNIVQVTDSYSKKDILKKIIYYALPFVLIDLIKSLYGMVDSVTVVKTLVKLGYSMETAETVFGVIATWGTKLNMIIISISMGITISLVPNLSASLAKKNFKDVNQKINQSLNIMLFFTIPMSVGISFLAKPVWIIFYGYNQISINVFRVFILQVIFFGLYTTIINISQTLNETKTSLIMLIGSFVFKVILNIPSMYLLKYIGIDAYYGSIVVNALVEGLTFIITLLLLKKKYNFKFRFILKTLLKIMLCLILMLGFLVFLSLFIKMTSISRVGSIIYITIYSIAGCVIYVATALKINLFGDIFGINSVKAIIKKLRH
jgi:O-antigen/teichoic acid export membrane protein